MHGVAPHMCGQASRPLLDQGAGGRSPGFPSADCAGAEVALSVSSIQRSSALPDIPTSIEAGYPNSDLNFWIGIFAPAGTPRDIVARLSREIAIALADPAVREKLANQGVDPMTMGAYEFQTFVNAESVSMAELAKALNLKPQ